MDATINLNKIWELFSSLDTSRRVSFSKELNGLMSRYITPAAEEEDDLAKRRRLFEEYAGSWNMPEEIFPEGDVMKFIKSVEKDDDDALFKKLGIYDEVFAGH